jgi:hypothetical protein
MGASKNADEQALINDFEQHSSELPNQLSSIYPSGLGALDFQKFLAHITSHQVDVSSYDSGFDRSEKNRTGESRDTAEWFDDRFGAYIKINPSEYAKASGDGRSVLGAHEHFGPFHLNDHDCQLSCGMWLLHTPEFISLLHDDEQALVKTKLIQLARGGVIGIGGGGDYRPIQRKLAILQGDLTIIVANTDPEVRRGLIHKLLVDLQSHFALFPPAFHFEFKPSRELALSNLRSCKILLKASPEDQLRVFELLNANGTDGARKRFKSVADTLEFCRSFVTIGLKFVGH